VALRLALAGKAFAKLLSFFAIPVVMMVWPGIKSIEISKDKLTIQTNVAALQTNPANADAGNRIRSALGDIGSRPLAKPDTLTLIAPGAMAIGEEQTAKERIDQALQADPKSPEALALKNRIQTEASLPILTEQLKKNPADDAIKGKLENSVASLTGERILNPTSLANLAQAQTILGDQAGAAANIDKALEINPSMRQALELKVQIQSSGRT
jgi:tetratricopeptide (TPR) repeat protein